MKAGISRWRRRYRQPGNDAATVYLLGTLMATQTDEWRVTRSYMALDTSERVITRKHQERQLVECEAA